MTGIPNTSPHYALVMDERRHLIFSLFMQVIMISPSSRELFDALLRQHKVGMPELAEFINDWAEKEHKMGWCKDPDCKVPNGNQEL